MQSQKKTWFINRSLKLEECVDVLRAPALLELSPRKGIFIHFKEFFSLYEYQLFLLYEYPTSICADFVS
jgi:hypothetical protein